MGDTTGDFLRAGGSGPSAFPLGGGGQPAVRGEWQAPPPGRPRLPYFCVVAGRPAAPQPSVALGASA
eukprot:1156771-Pyramimonas_sp.AAC.1